jgi:hypothetical protein
MFNFFKKRRERKEREAQMKIKRASIVRQDLKEVEKRAEAVADKHSSSSHW